MPRQFEDGSGERVPHGFDLLSSFSNRWPLERWREDVVLLAVSGGADSMALLALVTSLAPELDRIKVVHVNHGLRGAESDADEDFVLNQCIERGVECLSVRLESSELNGHSEESLRKGRYCAILDSAIAVGARWIALAHHQDDNLETFLMRLFRGTGLRGLEGIPFTREANLDQGKCDFVRPLIDVSREAILHWLDAGGIPCRTDSSNSSNAYYRNRVRNELIPAIDQLGQVEWKEKIVSLMRDIGARNAALRMQVSTLANSGVTLSSDRQRVQFSLDLFRTNGWEAMRELLVEICLRMHWPLKYLGRKHWDRIRETLVAACGSPHPQRIHLPSGLRFEIKRKQVYFFREQDD